eukprot:6618389-Prymnesium_polylepis.2
MLCRLESARADRVSPPSGWACRCPSAPSARGPSASSSSRPSGRQRPSAAPWRHPCALGRFRFLFGMWVDPQHSSAE